MAGTLSPGKPSVLDALAPKTAIVIVHGVQPHPRYEIQDACASNLCAQLNGDARFNSRTWTVDIVQPHGAAGADPLPTVSRVHVEEDVDGQKSPIIDVVEAYWSPLDKGLTNVKSVLTWLLRALFVPLNTTAKYASSAAKTSYELAFIILAALLALALLAGSLYGTLLAAKYVIQFQGCAGKSDCSPGIFDLMKPQTWVNFFSPWTIAILVITAIGAFLFAQALKAGFAWLSQVLNYAPGQRRWRILLILLIALVGVLPIVVAAGIKGTNAASLGESAILFVFAAAALLGGRSVLQTFFVNFFSDVQIYTTHDENNKFFEARTKMLQLVSAVLRQTCSTIACDGAPYDRVILFGHSLGSSIAMDAIMQFYQRCQQGSSQWDDFYRLRAFVTFGTALEKTKYFFDIQNPSPSMSYEQWRNDAYGALFTPSVKALDQPRTSLDTGIFWVNYWYFLDPICSPIASYRSYLIPGEAIRDAQEIRAHIKQRVPKGKAVIPRLVCRDEPRWHFFCFPAIIPHSEYLFDSHFWQSRDGRLGALDVVARPAATVPSPQIEPWLADLVPVVARARGPSGRLLDESARELNLDKTPMTSRAEMVSPQVAGLFSDRYEA